MYYTFHWACIINSLLSLFLGILVYIKGTDKKLKTIWMFLSISITLWGFGLGMMTRSATPTAALFWLRYVHYFSIVFFPSVFLHFCANFLGISKSQKWVILIGYIISFILEILNLTGLLASIQIVDYFNYYTKAGLFYPVFTAYFFIYGFYTLTLVFIHFLKSKGHKRNQLRYYLTALIIGYFSGSTAFFPVFEIKIFPLGIYFFSVYSILTSYTILRYNLLDLNLVIKRSTIYALMIIITTSIFIATTFSLESLFQQYIGYYSLATRIIAGIIIAITFLPIRNKLEQLIDKLFFNEKVEYLNSLHTFSKNLVTILDLKKLKRSIIKTIIKTLKIKNVRLYFYDESQKIFTIEHNRSHSDTDNYEHMSLKNPIITWLNTYKKVAIKDNFMDMAYNTESADIINQFDRLNCVIAIPIIFNDRLLGFIGLGKKINDNLFNPEELSLLQSVGNQVAIAYSNAKSYDNLKRVYIGTIDAFVNAIEAKDEYTRGHSDRVMIIAKNIARQLHLSEEEIELLEYSCLLHDIGKIGIDNQILNKQAKLSPEEQQEMQKHPTIGKNIVSSIDFLKETAMIIHYHHERWDGQGYPDGLKGEDIPLSARIICVADTLDALTSTRSYRKACSYHEAFNEIKAHSGTQFDPKVVDALIAVYSKQYD